MIPEAPVLSKFDDYPIHQTSQPIAQPATGDRNAYDRYWFNGFQDDGEFYFGIGAALYPNLGILDCGLSIVRDGEQHAFHASRRAPVEPTDLQIGPFAIEVLEPMRKIRVSVDDNDTGIAADLTFTARTACIEEGRQIRHDGRRLTMDVTRFAQFGRWEGEIRYDGRTVRVDPSRVYGVKDRSWGVRPVGPPDPGLAPSEPGSRQAFFLWAPLHWDDRCTHFGVFEDADGNRWHSDGAVLPVYDDSADIPGAVDPGTEQLAAVEHDITVPPGHSSRRSRRDRARARRRRTRGHRPRTAHLLPDEGHRLHAPRVGPRHVEGRARVRGRVVEGRRPRPDGVREPAPPAGGARDAQGRHGGVRRLRADLLRPPRATGSGSCSTPPDRPGTGVRGCG